MIISVANSKTSKIWKPIELTWVDFLERAKNTIRTPETVAEYRDLPKSQQDQIKNVGGFVGGQLKDGVRKNGFVEFRSMLTLDMDYAEQIKPFGFACCIYSTHKHTPEKPRLRLIIPLSRNVTADEYTAVARMVAYDIGIEQFDDTTYEPTRLMYWASTSADGEFLFQEQKGEILIPDSVLARYDDWHDTSKYPVSTRQNTIVRHSLIAQADPANKEGIVGIFCRAYDICSAIETFLADVYEPCDIPDRYSYIPADSTAGVVVYDDKFAYSHHASDPVCSKLCNSFDLVRLHKFGDLDSTANEDTSPSKMPSYTAMQELLLKDAGVKKQMALEREAQISEDFEDWQSLLTVNKKGEVVNSLRNLILILENDESLKSIVFNQLFDGMEIKCSVPWKHPTKYWRDADDAQLTAYIDGKYGSFTDRNYNIAITKVTDDRSYHPIREYLDDLPEWDKVPRLDTLFVNYFASADTAYTRAVTRKVFTAAVARVYKPGIKFDWMLVLNGATGIGKSTLIQRLAGEWFSDSLKLGDTQDKTGAEKLQGCWILEIGELAGMKKAEENELKSFLSSQNDIYRASFGKRATPHPRQCIFIGTTNEDRGYLRDTTGNRRFWPLKVYKTDKKPWDMTDEEVQQIWAEAKMQFNTGEPLQLSAELEKYAALMQSEAMEKDDRQGIVESYLEMLLPDDWDNMELFSRREYINEYHNAESIISKGTKERTHVSIIEIWSEAFGKNKADLERYKSNEIVKMLQHIKGWKKSDKRVSGGIYGQRRIFERD